MITFIKPFLLSGIIFLSLLTNTKVSAETYVTEKNVQIDRCACAWFITRFLDEDPTFTFIKQGETPPTGISYDFFGADYFHKGPDCSFTGFIKTHIKKNNPSLIDMNDIVNDVFAWRNGPNSLSVSIKKHIDVLAEQGKSDTEIYEECLLIFDLLYLKGAGDINEMHGAGKKSLQSIEQRLLEAIYAEKNHDIPLMIEAKQPARQASPFNSKSLISILKEQQTEGTIETSLHALSLRILKAP